MADYTGGYTSAVNEISSRDLRDTETRRLLFSLVEATEAAQRKKTRDTEFDTKYSGGIPSDFGGTGTPTAPPGVQSPAPGQGSVPMMQPGPPPMGAPGGMSMMPGAAPQGPPPGVPPQGMAPGMAPGAPPPAPPPASPPAMAAIPASTSQMPSGAPPQAPAAPPAAMPHAPWQTMPGAEGGMPSSAAAMFDAPEGSPAAQQVDKMVGAVQKKVLNPVDLMNNMIQKGMKPSDALEKMKELEPIIDHHNKTVFDDMRIKIEADDLAQRTRRNYILDQQKERENRARDRANDLKEAELDPTRAGSKAWTRVEGAGTRKQLADFKTRGSSKGGIGNGDNATMADVIHGGSVGGKWGQDTIRWYALQDIMGDRTWRTGLGRTGLGSKNISAVDEYVPVLSKELNISPQDAGTIKAKRVAMTAALRDQTKRLETARPFIENFNKQADLVEEYASKGTAGSLPIINKWIQAGRKATGDPDVSAFDSAVRGAGREHQRIVTGLTSNAQLLAAAHKMSDTLLNIDQNPEQIAATLGEMRKEARNLIVAQENEVSSLEDRMTTMVGSGEKKPAAATSDTREFKSEAEAAAAGLKPGTKIKINGVSGTWH